MHRRAGVGLSALAVVIGLLALASSASARVARTVYAGPPPDTQQVASHYVSKNFVAKYQPDFNAFFNHRTVIHVGDKVRFKIDGFHTVDLPGKSGKDLPFVIPTGSLVTGQNDAAGHPFWFNGLPNVGVNPALFARSKSRRYNGKGRIDSGIASSKPLTVKFTKAGRYKFYCDIHPGMVGYIVVRARHKRIQSRRQARAAGLAQLKADIVSAINLAKYKPPKNTVSLGNSARNGVELYTMFPSTLHVKKGTTVSFDMSRFSRETHTATFGPGSYVKPISDSFHGAVFSPLGTYPSSPPPGPIDGNASSHGNGFFNTGTLDQDPGTTTIGPSSKIDFTQAGTYTYECAIHPWMHGTIIVHK